MLFVDNHDIMQKIYVIRGEKMKKTIIAMIMTIWLATLLAACTGNSTHTTLTAEQYSFNNAITVQSGDIIEFGGLDWIVLHIENDQALLLSNNILGQRRFDASSNNWESSEMREYLNHSFFTSTFSENERERIAETELITDGNITVDRIFLLSRDEFNKYMGADADIYIRNARIGRFRDTAIWWRLRSPSEHIDIRGRETVEGVDSAGHFGGAGHVCHVGGGVRPALWLKL